MVCLHGLFANCVKVSLAATTISANDKPGLPRAGAAEGSSGSEGRLVNDCLATALIAWLS